jgi:hypothetical protein
MMCAKWNLPLSLLPLKLAGVTLMILAAFWIAGEFQLADILPSRRSRSSQIKILGEETGNPT